MHFVTILIAFIINIFPFIQCLGVYIFIISGRVAKQTPLSTMLPTAKRSIIDLQNLNVLKILKLRS